MKQGPDQDDDSQKDFITIGLKTAIDGLCQKIQLQQTQQTNDFKNFLTKLSKYLVVEINKNLPEYNGIKVCVNLDVEYVKSSKHDQAPLEFYINTGGVPVIKRFQVTETSGRIQHTFLRCNDHFIREQSGLVMENNCLVELGFIKFIPMIGRFLKKTPQLLHRKKLQLMLRTATKGRLDMQY